MKPGSILSISEDAGSYDFFFAFSEHLESF